MKANFSQPLQIQLPSKPLSLKSILAMNISLILAHV